MSTYPTQAPPQGYPGPHPTEGHAYVQVLHDLITMGTDLARLVHHQATAQPQTPHPPTQTPGHPTPAPSPEPLISLTTAFDRIARAVRRSILLARTLAKPVQPAPDPAHHRAAARRRILREVEDAIQRSANSAPHPNAERPDAGTLTAELHDRLDAPDLDDDLATRPIPDIITEICRDLGLAACPGTDPWKRRTPADIQRLCARAAAARPAITPQPATPAPARTTPQSSNPGQPPPINLHPRAPAQPGSRNDPAEAIATILRHPGLRTRPHPPPNP